MFADVTSANVVGYQNKAMAADGSNNFVVRTLNQMATDWDDCELGMLTVTLVDKDGNGGWDPWMDNLMTLDPANGLPLETYAYFSPYYAEQYGVPAGWYTADEIIGLDEDPQIIPEKTRDDVKINFRDGFKVVIASGNEVTVNNAGEVLSKGWIPLSLNADGSNNFTGNVTPVNIKIGDIQVTETDLETGMGGWDPWMDVLCKLDPANGLPVETYTYMTPYYAAGDYSCDPGWYTTTDLENADNLGIPLQGKCQNEKVSFDAGEAFKVVIASGNEVQLFIPSALGTDTAKPE